MILSVLCVLFIIVDMEAWSGVHTGFGVPLHC